jgi:hypothetical protein
MERLEDIEAAIRGGMPDWIEDVRVSAMTDADGEPALAVILGIRVARVGVVDDASALAEAREAVHRALAQMGVDLWPYTRFLRADEMQAA